MDKIQTDTFAADLTKISIRDFIVSSFRFTISGKQTEIVL